MTDYTNPYVTSGTESQYQSAKVGSLKLNTFVLWPLRCFAVFSQFSLRVFVFVLLSSFFLYCYLSTQRILKPSNLKPFSRVLALKVMT
jgi:hypothetical protein